MTISTTTSRQQFQGNDVAVSFAFNFLITATSDIELTHTDAAGVQTVLVLDANHSITFVEGVAGGTISYPLTGDPLATGELLTARRLLPLTQPADLLNQGKFLAEVHEDEFDRLCMQIQQLQEAIDRGIVLPIDTGLGTIILTPTADAWLRWNASGDDIIPVSTVAPTSATVTAWAQTLLDDANAAAARTTMGLGASKGLTNLLHPSVSGGWGDLHDAGFRHAGFNQQWGGAPWGGLPNGLDGEIATGFIAQDTGNNFGTPTNGMWFAQPFKLSQAQTIADAWFKIYKTGNPQKDTEPFEVTICPDSGGEPDETSPLITFTTANGNSMAAASEPWEFSTQFEWVNFTGDSAALSADTLYWLVGHASGADASNHFTYAQCQMNSYPFGDALYGDDASPSNWDAFGTPPNICFLIGAPAATRVLQPSGLFDAKVKCFEGAPLNQSGGLSQPLAHFFDEEEGSLLIRGADFTSGKTFLDCIWGIDHDRIVLRCESNKPKVYLYESDGTVVSVTGGTSISSGTFDVGVRYRAKGDSADYLELFVDGVSDATPLTAQNFTLSPNMKRFGTCWYGCGFPAKPVWDDDEDMSALPSAGLYTWMGTGTEANCMAVSGGNLLQREDGYASTDTGFYKYIPTTLVNGTGWCVAAKMKVTSAPQAGLATPPPYGVNAECEIFVQDGTKQIGVSFGLTFGLTGDGTSSDFDFPLDATQEFVVMLQGKGSDYSVFVNGALVADGTAMLDEAVGTQQISFGDVSNVAGENANAVWEYVKYYDAGNLAPEFSSMSINEVSFWSGDASAFFPILYNSGTQISVKEMAAVGKNYLEFVPTRAWRQGVISNTSTNSNSFVRQSEMHLFATGSKFRTDVGTALYSGLDNAWVSAGLYFDGARFKGVDMYGDSAGANGHVFLSGALISNSFSGLHWVDSRFATVTGQVCYGHVQNRQILMESIK